MNYATAKRKARNLFGDNADVRAYKLADRLGYHYEVGIWMRRIFTVLGAGESWEEAFITRGDVGDGKED